MRPVETLSLILAKVPSKVGPSFCWSAASLFHLLPITKYILIVNSCMRYELQQYQVASMYLLILPKSSKRSCIHQNRLAFTSTSSTHHVTKMPHLMLTQHIRSVEIWYDPMITARYLQRTQEEQHPRDIQLSLH